MLKWNEHLYCGEGIKNPARLREKIEQGKLLPGIYVITLSENPGNLLEMFPAISLKQQWARSLCPEIIGLAKGKEGAIDLVQDILMEIHEDTGAFQIREYMKNR